MDVAAQVPLMCKFCEKSSKIRWKCYNCELLLCTDCKDGAHLKLRNAREHNVVELVEIVNETTEGKQDKTAGKLVCSTHEENDLNVYCETCSMLVCQACIHETHGEHSMKEIRPSLRRKQQLRNAQVTLACELCGNGKNIFWKCVQCNWFMCSKCKEGMHLHIRNARDHTVIDLKESSSDNQTDRIPNVNPRERLSCDFHAGNVFSMMCETCDKLICSECLSEKHIQHQVAKEIKIESAF